jgi:hypothetical protein
MRPTPADKTPDLKLSDEVELFSRLAQARRRGDIREGQKLLRELREVGWSVAAIEPRRPGGAE